MDSVTASHCRIAKIPLKLQTTANERGMTGQLTKSLKSVSLVRLQSRSASGLNSGCGSRCLTSILLETPCGRLKRWNRCKAEIQIRACIQAAVLEFGYSPWSDPSLQGLLPLGHGLTAWPPRGPVLRESPPDLTNMLVL